MSHRLCVWWKVSRSPHPLILWWVFTGRLKREEGDWEP